MTRYTTTFSGNLDQGDILAPLDVRLYLPWWPSEDKLPLIVVTPACDLAQERATFHRLCVLQPFPALLYFLATSADLLKAHWDGIDVVPKKKGQSILEKLKNAVTHKWPRYHFFPRETAVFETDYVIDFELIISAPLNHLASTPRHARLNAPYKQELIQRLASHLMRIGTPDIATPDVEKSVRDCISTTKLRFA